MTTQNIEQNCRRADQQVDGQVGVQASAGCGQFVNWQVGGLDESGFLSLLTVFWLDYRELT